MNHYILSSLIAFVLFGMGAFSLFFGSINYKENKESKNSANMYYLLICTFFWIFGYAWMSLCYESDFAYVARAIALFAVYSYIYFLLRYVSQLVNYKAKWLNVYYFVFAIASVASWLKIIEKDSVSFEVTAWGYWYVSSISWGRILQFAIVIVALIGYYVIVISGIRKAKLKREKSIFKGYLWFGPILIMGYTLDTLIPSIFKVPAIPGSSVGAFFSTMLLFGLSKKYRAFGISKDNISEFVFQDVNVPVLITDYEGKIALYNGYFPRFFEFEEENLLGMQLKSLLTNIKKDENDIYVIEKKNGEKVEFKVAETKVKDRFGELMYSIRFFQDMTTEQIHLRALEQSRQEAEDANMAKSNFLANMSHEIRTPMNAIIGMSEIVLQNDPDNSAADDIKSIRVAAKNLLGIINDILDISKIEAGRYEIIDEDYKISELLNDVSSIIRVRILESKTRFVVDINPDIPEDMYGDQVRIRQLLLNILGNAVKFTKQGAITLSVNWNGDKVNPEMYFDVKDTGMGIKEEDIDKIFGAFNQVDTRKNRSVQGTGLGLAISKELAKLMGGDITVESEYGIGSTFHIVIKQVVNNYAPIGEGTCKSIIEGTYSVDKNNINTEEIKRPDAKVLIVDDIEMNLIIAQGLLQKYDINADIASSGKDAIAMVMEKDYDLIFMDHMMPEMDGIDTTREIRKIPKEVNKNTTIVALTANAINDAKDMFLKEGLQDFVAKPIDPAALDEVILKWL